MEGRAEKVKIIDGTPEEFAFVGHPEWRGMFRWPYDERKHGDLRTVRNERHVRLAGQGDRATRDFSWFMSLGGRGAMAVDQLAAAGFTGAYIFVDGIEVKRSTTRKRVSRQEDEERLEELRALGGRRGSGESHHRGACDEMDGAAEEAATMKQIPGGQRTAPSRECARERRQGRD